LVDGPRVRVLPGAVAVVLVLAGLAGAAPTYDTPQRLPAGVSDEQALFDYEVATVGRAHAATTSDAKQVGQT